MESNNTHVGKVFNGEFGRSYRQFFSSWPISSWSSLHYQLKVGDSDWVDIPLAESYGSSFHNMHDIHIAFRLLCDIPKSYDPYNPDDLGDSESDIVDPRVVAFYEREKSLIEIGRLSAHKALSSFPVVSPSRNRACI